MCDAPWEAWLLYTRHLSVRPALAAYELGSSDTAVWASWRASARSEASGEVSVSPVAIQERMATQHRRVEDLARWLDLMTTGRPGEEKKSGATGLAAAPTPARDEGGVAMTAEDTRSKEQPIDWDAPITLQDAADIAGVAYATLKAWMRAGYLETAPWGARGKVTTRRKLDACVRQRGTRGGGRGPAPKPLPADYQAPPRRGRPPKAKAAPPTAGEEGRIAPC